MILSDTLREAAIADETALADTQRAAAAAQGIGVDYATTAAPGSGCDPATDFGQCYNPEVEGGVAGPTPSLSEALNITATTLTRPIKSAVQGVGDWFEQFGQQVKVVAVVALGLTAIIAVGYTVRAFR
jgi:hypothetical protein